MGGRLAFPGSPCAARLSALQRHCSIDTRRHSERLVAMSDAGQFDQSLIGGRFKQTEQSEPTASASGEVHRKPLQIGKRAVVEGAFRSPGLRPGKPNWGIGVARSLPHDLEKSRNSSVMIAQTV
jgi:hypothetical protein